MALNKEAWDIVFKSQPPPALQQELDRARQHLEDSLRWQMPQQIVDVARVNYERALYQKQQANALYQQGIYPNTLAAVAPLRPSLMPMTYQEPSGWFLRTDVATQVYSSPPSAKWQGGDQMTSGDDAEQLLPEGARDADGVLKPAETEVDRIMYGVAAASTMRIREDEDDQFPDEILCEEIKRLREELATANQAAKKFYEIRWKADIIDMFRRADRTYAVRAIPCPDCSHQLSIERNFETDGFEVKCEICTFKTFAGQGLASKPREPEPGIFGDIPLEPPPAPQMSSQEYWGKEVERLAYEYGPIIASGKAPCPTPSCRGVLGHSVDNIFGRGEHTVICHSCNWHIKIPKEAWSGRAMNQMRHGPMGKCQDCNKVEPMYMPGKCFACAVPF